MRTTNELVLMVVSLVVVMMMVVDALDTNYIYDPCSDAVVQKSDGFSFGIAFSTKESFFFNQTQLSPCDIRLSLAGLNAQLAVFRPTVDELSLLTVNSSTFSPRALFCLLAFSSSVVVGYCNQGESELDVVSSGLVKLFGSKIYVLSMHGGYMVAFAGRKYAARSPPAFVADNTNIITSFTLILEFQKGTLQNLFWKKDGCDSCSGKSSFVCVNQQDCAVTASSCQSNGGSMDCSLGIQLAFSGTDKNHEVLNSWYEVQNLRQYSLYGLYSDLKDSLSSQYNNFL